MGVDPLSIISGVTSVIPAVTGIVDRYTAASDPTMQGIQQWQMGRWNDAMNGQNPYGDQYGGYGMFGQLGGQNMSSWQGQNAYLANQLNNPNAANDVFQRNLQGLSQMQSPQLQDSTAGLMSAMGRAPMQSFNQGSYGFTPGVSNSMGGTQQAGAAGMQPAQGYPGVGSMSVTRGPLASLFGTGVEGTLPQSGTQDTSGGWYPGKYVGQIGDAIGNFFNPNQGQQQSGAKAYPQQQMDMGQMQQQLGQQRAYSGQQNNVGAQHQSSGQKDLTYGNGGLPSILPTTSTHIAAPQTGGTYSGTSQGQGNMPQIQAPRPQATWAQPQQGFSPTQAIMSGQGMPQTPTALGQLQQLAGQGMGQGAQRSMNASVQAPSALNGIEGLNQTGAVAQSLFANPTAQSPEALARLQGMAGGGPTDATQAALSQQYQSPQALQQLQNMAGNTFGNATQNAINAGPVNPQGMTALQGMNQASSVTNQVAANPTSMNQNVQNQIYNQGQQTIDASTREMQRQMRENAAASGSLGTGAYNGAQQGADIARMQQLANLRQSTGIEAAKTNFNDMLQASGLQQADLGRMYGQQLSTTGLQNTVGQQNVANQFSQAGIEQGAQGQGYNQMANTAGLQMQDQSQGYTQNMGRADLSNQNRTMGYNEMANLAGLQSDVNQNLFGNRATTAGLEAQLGNQQFGNQLQLGGMQNQIGQQNFANTMGQGQFEQDAQQQQYGQMAGLTGMQNDIGNSQYQNLLNAGQFQMGAEGQLANQVNAQNAMQQGQFNTDYQRYNQLAGQMNQAGNAAETRNNDIWNQFGNLGNQAMGYEQSQLSPLVSMQKWRLNPSQVSNVNFTNPYVQQGGATSGQSSGGMSPQLLAQLSQMAGQYAGQGGA